MRWASRKVAPPGTVVPTPGARDGSREVDIQADMQQGIRPGCRVEHAPQQHAHAAFVNEAHVNHVDPTRAQQLLLAPIDRADPEHVQVAGLKRRARLVTKHRLQPRFAGQESRGHAMHVAGRCRGRGVVVGVRIEPKHEKLAPIPAHAGRRRSPSPSRGCGHRRVGSDSHLQGACAVTKRFRSKGSASGISGLRLAICVGVCAF